MTDRRTFIQSTGATDAQFAGYQLLKLLSYSPNNTSSLQPGQQLSAGGLIGEFAADQADNIDTNRFGFSVENPAAGYDAAAATLADWTFVSHQQLAGGLTALTVRDTSGAYWVVFDGVDSAGGLVETPFDMMEALNIVLSVGYDPHGSTQFDAATAYLHDLQQTLSPGAKINGIGQSLGGAVLKALALSNPGAFGSVIALDSPGLNNGWVARLESEYRAIASSGIAVDLPFIFEYGLGADFIRGWRFGSLADFYADLQGTLGGGAGGGYTSYISDFSTTLPANPVESHVNSGLLESALFAQSPGGFTVTRQKLITLGLGWIIVEEWEDFAPDGHVVSRGASFVDSGGPLFFDFSSADLSNIQGLTVTNASSVDRAFASVNLTFSLPGADGNRFFRARTTSFAEPTSPVVLPNGTIGLMLNDSGLPEAADATGRALKLGNSSHKEPVTFAKVEELDSSGAVVRTERRATWLARPLSFGQLGSIFGSNLSKLIQTDDPWAALGIGTLIGAIGLNIGQGIDNALDSSGASTFFNAFDNLPTELRDAGVGAISSYLFAEFVNDQGLDGVEGQFVSTTGGAAISQIATNLLHLGEPATNLLGQYVNASGTVVATSAEAAPTTWSTNVGGALLNAAGAFIGTYLASQLIEFDNLGGQYGSAIGTAIGAWIGAKIGGLISGGNGYAAAAGAAIGAFAGYIDGGLIGSLFGFAPKTGSSLGFDESSQRFAVTNVWSKNQGMKATAMSLGGAVAQALNLVIEASGARVLDAAGVQTGAYETKGKKFIYKTSASGAYAWRTKDPDQLITHGQFIALSDLSTRLMGGDVTIKRALSATLAAAGGDDQAAANDNRVTVAQAA